MIAVCPHSWATWIIFPLWGNEIIQADKMLLGMDAPDACRCGCGLKIFMLGAKKKIVIKMISLAQAQVIAVATLIFQGLGQSIRNPGGNL